MECNEKVITQSQFCSREFDIINEKLMEMQENIKSLRSLIIGQFSALGLALIVYVLQQIK